MTRKITAIADAVTGPVGPDYYDDLDIYRFIGFSYNAEYTNLSQPADFKKENNATSSLWASINEFMESANLSTYIDFVDYSETYSDGTHFKCALSSLPQFISTVKLRLYVSLNGSSTPVSLNDFIIAYHIPGGSQNNHHEILASNFTVGPGLNRGDPVVISNTTPEIIEIPLTVGPWISESEKTAHIGDNLTLAFHISSGATNLRIYAVDVVVTDELNDSGTGGVTAGSSATVTAKYNPTVSGSAIVGPHHDPVYYFNTGSGGVQIGGLFLRSYSNILGSGGAVVAGTAHNLVQYNPTTSGGVVCGIRVYEMLGDGGAKVGGLANVDLKYNPTTSGGVIITGLIQLQPAIKALDEYVDLVDITDYLSVSLSAGQPDASFILKFQELEKIPFAVDVRISASSSLCTWIVQSLTLYDKNDVIIARMTTCEDCVDCEPTEGEEPQNLGCFWVAYDAGNGVLDWRLDESNCSNPCLCDSLPPIAPPANLSSTYETSCVNFGVVDSKKIEGTAARPYTYSLEMAIEYAEIWDLSEVYLQLDANIDDYNYDKIATIYALELDIYDDLGSGVLINGSYVNVFNETASGGVVVAGNVLAPIIYCPSISGGVVTGGHVLDRIIYYPISSGGVVIGGTSLSPAIYFTHMRGGAVVAGVAKLGDEEVGTGGVACGGNKSTYFITHRIRSNHDGVLANGSCVINVTVKNKVGTGGVICGGNKTLNVYYTPTTTGGVVIGGSKTKFGVVRRAVASGGAIVNGFCILYKVSHLTASGGVIVGITSIPMIQYNPITTGGVVVAGRGNVNVYRDYRTVTSGEVLIEGDAIELFKLYYTGSGQVTTGGDAIYDKEYIYIRCVASGKVIVGGIPTIIHDTYITESNSGLLLIGGRAEYGYTYFDRTCAPTNVLPCIAKFPNKYRECYISRYYLPAKQRLIPKSLNKNGAYVPAITFCQQGLFVPPPDPKFEPRG